MAQRAEDGTIYGSRLTWETGILLNDGTIDASYTTYLTAPDYIPISGKTLIYTGPRQDANDNYYYLYIAQYKSDKTLINRTQMTSTASIREFDTWDDCAYIRISMGRATSTGIAATTSDTALLVMSVQDRKPNRFVDWSYSADSGDTVYSMSDNVLTITKWKAVSSNNLAVSAQRPIVAASGDTMRIVVTKKSGSVSASIYVNANAGGKAIANNVSWGTGTTALDVSTTLTDTANNASVTFKNRSYAPAYSNYKAQIAVYKNGVQILPEVAS